MADESTRRRSPLDLITPSVNEVTGEKTLIPFSSRLHEPRTAAILGIALGVFFTTCFATGLLSHLIQEPPGWFHWPSRPAGFYRVSQSVHVVAGIATIPLLLAKLWVVAPKFWTWPPVKNAAHAVERISLIPLVGGGVFLLFSGLLNVARWYPWPFFFPRAHYWAAWIMIGALIAHIGAKSTTTRAALRRGAGVPLVVADTKVRRRFLVGAAATSGVLVAATIGNTVGPLRWLSVLAQRRPGFGPQGLPVQRSAADTSGVLTGAHDPNWRLVVSGKVATRLELSLDELRKLPQHSAELPIACVEGWSQSAKWSGVRVRDLLEKAGAAPGATVRVESFQNGGLYRKSELNESHAHDVDTLLALDLNGEPLHVDHGFPARLIGPNRPGVMQTKWVRELVVQ